MTAIIVIVFIVYSIQPSLLNYILYIFKPGSYRMWEWSTIRHEPGLAYLPCFLQLQYSFNTHKELRDFWFLPQTKHNQSRHKISTVNNLCTNCKSVVSMTAVSPIPRGASQVSRLTLTSIYSTMFPVHHVKVSDFPSFTRPIGEVLTTEEAAIKTIYLRKHILFRRS